jgi:transposase
MEVVMSYFAGIDWGGAEHALCVVDDAGRIALALQVRHDTEGLRSLREQLRRLGPPASLPIAIERPSGLIVDTLIQAGHPVIPIHPNAVKACRPRYRAAGGKHDPGDAYLLADVLRTDGHRFRPLTPNSDAIQALRALVRTRDDFVAERIALANQLRALLESFWPGAAVIFAEIDSPIALAFIERYPTPRSTARLGEKRLASFLAAEHYCGRRPATELLLRLHEAPRGCVGPLEQEAKGELARALSRILASLVNEIARLTARIEHDVAQLDDGAIVMSLPRAGRLNAAQILVELGDVRERFATDAQLAAEAGVAPVTYQSGKTRAVTFRWACNHRLRRAITGWADNSRRACPWANDIYAKARARGCDHPHAVRVLARAWVRVLWKLWTDRVTYRPENHGGAKPFLIAA